MFYTVKNELNAIPLNELFEKVTTAGDLVREGLLEAAEKAHERKSAKMMEAMYKNSEESFEGNAGDMFPFPGLDEEFLESESKAARLEAMRQFIEKYELIKASSWLLPQITAYVAKMPLTRLEDGKIDSRAFKKNFGKDDWHKGLWTLLMHHTRGDFVPKQYTADYRNYSSLVPLLLMPFKKFDNIPYSDWGLDGLEYVVDSHIYNALTYEQDFEITRDQIIAARTEGLKVKTGKTAGSSRNPVSTHKLYGLPGPLAKMPWLAQVMMFQIWCAHPVNRTNLMILDWVNWDYIPDPLIVDNPMQNNAPIVKSIRKSVSHWDD